MPLTQDQECDVLVVGTGAAGLTAALATSVAGCDTIILEKTAWLGGTSAISAGGLWVPANHHARSAGIADSPDEALAYIRALAPPGWQETEDHLWRRFVDQAPQMLAFVETHSPLRCRVTEQPDPFPAVSGAKLRGRMVSPQPLSRWIIGRYGRRLRPPMLPHVFTYQEYLRLDPYHHPIAASLKRSPRILARLISNARAMGTALIAGLIKGCVERSCRIELKARASELIVDGDDRVRGALVEQGGRLCRIGARRGVVLATGGFEWNATLVAKHFPGPVDFITSPRGNEGDGHAMAERAGAVLAHMDQANLSPALPIIYEGRSQGMSLAFHREPNSILVDRTGRRFVDEYRFNIGEVIDARDPATGMPRHLPAWLITDSRFLERSPMTRWFSKYDEGWITRADGIEELARCIRLPEAALRNTVEQFNAFCAAGVDAEFQRGEGRPVQEALMPIAQPPFLAIPFNRSFISTKGGPRTNENGEVLRRDGSVIGGLFCAGVAMANPIGTWAIGAGTTLGPNMTWGYICGQTLAGGSSGSGIGAGQ